MDRRRRPHFRFQPGPESLEGRQLLASATTAAPANRPAQVQSSAALTPINPQLQTKRIENLPFHLQTFYRDQDERLPDDLALKLQNDLRALQGSLTHRPRIQIANFNRELRGPVSSKSLSASDAADLNQAFGQTLVAAGADSRIVLNLQNDLLEISQFNARFAQSARLTANVYALTMQVALQVGHPAADPQAAVGTGVGTRNGSNVGSINGQPGGPLGAFYN